MSILIVVDLLAWSVCKTVPVRYNFTTIFEYNRAIVLTSFAVLLGGAAKRRAELQLPWRLCFSSAIAYAPPNLLSQSRKMVYIVLNISVLP